MSCTRETGARRAGAGRGRPDRADPVRHRRGRDEWDGYRHLPDPGRDVAAGLRGAPDPRRHPAPDAHPRGLGRAGQRRDLARRGAAAVHGGSGRALCPLGSGPAPATDHRTPRAKEMQRADFAGAAPEPMVEAPVVYEEAAAIGAALDGISVTYDYAPPVTLRPAPTRYASRWATSRWSRRSLPVPRRALTRPLLSPPASPTTRPRSCCRRSGCISISTGSSPALGGCP